MKHLFHQRIDERRMDGMTVIGPEQILQVFCGEA
jgi:hypothetical protein